VRDGFEQRLWRVVRLGYLGGRGKRRPYDGKTKDEYGRVVNASPYGGRGKDALSAPRLSFLRFVVLRLVRSCGFIAGSIDLKIGETTMREWRKTGGWRLEV